MTTATEAKEVRLTEAAALVNRSEWTLRRWLVEGRITGRKVAGRVMVNRASLEHVLQGEPVARLVAEERDANATPAK